MLFGFNTQPPEGGCCLKNWLALGGSRFNTQPPEGGCAVAGFLGFSEAVSTHSRPKAAAIGDVVLIQVGSVSTHSRPKAAADNTQSGGTGKRSFNTQPPEGGCSGIEVLSGGHPKFQHTAARRRLRLPKGYAENPCCFNTQPPEGGCSTLFGCDSIYYCFNTQPPEGGCQQPFEFEPSAS